MTRINLIDPILLKREHLISEYRELPRVFKLVRESIKRGEHPYDKRNPTFYTMGTGHVRFFYNKCLWLVNRQQKLVDECIQRGYNIQHIEPSNLIEGIPEEWRRDWYPNKSEIQKNLDRLIEKDYDHYSWINP